ncbi:isoaspartyl peptidase/L-asparaginase family protein [Microlunatus soli]|uniref:Asparaginase n=1 Tax=Microlunatus soli TaxID=630515 RepID=A0A1H1ZRC4_9ACTN|nr:isoaspartyl peptidase/L-asparaginase [Microlunatus soli]SDT35952.1 asparaginase [Microlunatus soli]
MVDNPTGGPPAAEESVSAPVPTTVIELPPDRPYALAVHGGAGGRIAEFSGADRAGFQAGLENAYRAGDAVLRQGGSALDAVCATVVQLEDDALFNAGRGASLTAAGDAELDAAVMTGSGAAGAVAASTVARNPVLLARAVMERSQHVLLVAPPAELAAAWGLSVVDPDYFVTDARRAQLARLHAAATGGARHGTVGAVARDASGALAAATSTGGMANQWQGRVGDSPIIGAGTYARDELLAVSCTGHGEAFIRGVVSYDIAARMRYAGLDLAAAVSATIAEELTDRDASGGLVAVASDGTVVVAHNSPSLLAAYHDGRQVITLT